MSITQETLAALFIGVTGILLLYGLWEEGYGVRILRNRGIQRRADHE